jgi:hypothetical protein
VAFDDDSVHNSLVDVALVGSASYDTFCGDLISYEWRDITGGLPGTVIGSGGPILPTDPKLTIPNLAVTLATGGDHTDYTFKLCVTDATPTTACADVNVRASYNLPPTAAIAAVPAPISGCGGGGGGGGNSRVCLVDINGGGETFTAQGTCTDPENPVAFPSASPASCTWSVESVTFDSPLSPTGGLDGDPDSAGTAYTVAAPVGDGNIFLTATDDHGYFVQARTRVRVIAPVHDVAVTAIAQPAVVPATVGIAQNVNVTVRNNGHFAETFNVTLTDAIGGTGGAAQSVTLAACVTTLSENSHTQLSPCPFQALIFSWTPTAIAGQPHTLTATVTTVITGETNTADNSRSVSVALNNQPPVANPQSLTRNEDTSVPIITLAGTDLDGDPLTYQVVTGPSHGTVSGGTLASRTYTPTLNYNDAAVPDSFTFTVSDGSATSATATVSITVNAVNDAPSFTKGANQTVSAVAGAQTVTPWALFLNAGPLDESGQALDFIVSNNNNGLFTVQPAIAAGGTLTYTPLSTANGSATVTVRLHDNGGTSPGVDTSAAQTFTIQVSLPCSGLCTPANATATLTGVSRQVHVAWTERATSETRYERQRCRLIGTTSCSYSFLSPNLAVNANSFDDTVSSSGTYRYRVRACNVSSCSSFGVSNNIVVP